MNEIDRLGLIKRYLSEVVEQFNSGQAKEHAYRPALQRLMSSFEDILVVNDPKRSEHGAPDFVFLKKSNHKIIKGYAEAKDINTDLDKIEKTDQMKRYHGYASLFLTDYLEFRFFRNGEKNKSIRIGQVKNGKLLKLPENAESLVGELEAFLSQTPEQITSGLRLAQIMGGRARRIRDNVIEFLKTEDAKSQELLRIYGMMKELLVHDLEPEKFADMYAQTLVYGLFVARYSDSTSENFTRGEARDLVPKSNPFLLHFFDHIVGPNFDTRLAYIVDELCEIFSVSNVQDIVHRHLKVQEETVEDRDPIIHFYEDFLQEYDPNERKKMGAYYTPVPVVRYIVRQVDRILKEDFGISKGLASDEKITQTVASQPYRHPGDRKDRTTTEISVPRVQILDPAVGTATFLNETIKFIYQGFKGQEGRWPAYVNDNLLKRLFGFELMMAPYTIAHMKLGMTLKETGVDELNDRLGIYLTNTLEEGIPLQQDLFSFGLAEAVSEESRLAARVKSEHPVMVVMGNPPYSVSSTNKSKWILDLIADYKVGLNERKINLDDDYIKFIRFSENLIEKNGSGIVGMITNNSYLDGITHRQMRKHLLDTFDKIYIVDLHGSAMKKEVSPDGSKDGNVFAIMQGVSIVLMVKTNNKRGEFQDVHHADLFGPRERKFSLLNDESLEYARLAPVQPYFFFAPKDLSLAAEYGAGISIKSLFKVNNSGIKTDRDKLFLDFDKPTLSKRIQTLFSPPLEADFKKEFRVEDSSSYQLTKAINESQFSGEFIKLEQYRPFDYRFIYYDRKVISRPAYSVMGHQDESNLMLLSTRQLSTFDYQHSFVSSDIIDICTLSSQTKETVYAMPLYIYHKDGDRITNLHQGYLSALTDQLQAEVTPEGVFDYIYATLNSPSYREKYKEFLKIDFPRIPIPTQGDFDRLAPLGRELRELHLMRSPVMDDFQTSFPAAGDCLVEKVSYADEKVWINKTQYFGNVPKLAWNFYIGGYQPAQKWLKDRKGRQLNDSDLVHYQRIIKILLETDRIMKEIG